MRCGHCCMTASSLRLHESEEFALRRFKEVGIDPQPCSAKGFFDIRLSSGRCPLLSPENACTIYGNRPRVCIAYPFSVWRDASNGRAFVMLLKSCGFSDPVGSFLKRHELSDKPEMLIALEAAESIARDMDPQFREKPAYPCARPRFLSSLA